MDTIFDGFSAALRAALRLLKILEKLSSTFTSKEVETPTGASPKREREYKKIERKFKKEGRYKGREEEVAARIVNKQRAAAGETAHRHKPPARSASRRKTRTTRSAARKKSS